MLDYLVHAAPFALLLILYFIRLERRLAIIITDISWIKTFILTNTNPDHAPIPPDPANDLPPHS